MNDLFKISLVIIIVTFILGVLIGAYVTMFDTLK